MKRKRVNPEEVKELKDLYNYILDGEIDYFGVISRTNNLTEVYNSNNDQGFGYSPYPTRIYRCNVDDLKVYVELNNTYVLLSWRLGDFEESILCDIA